MKFTVEIEPLPMSRPRFSRFGGVFYPKEIVAYKKKITAVAEQFMQTNNLEPMTGELKATINLYRKYKTVSRRYGDCDNHAKAILDALNGVCYVDDCQIVSCTVNKFTDKDRPRIEIDISECNSP